MHTLLAIIVGTLFATALYLLMRRNVIKLIIGLGLLTHAANLGIFVVGGVGEAVRPPIVADEPHHATVPVEEPHGERERPQRLEPGQAPQRPGAELVANPLPQALILTAIVIGFGTQAFAVVLIRRAVATLKTEDLDNLTSTDR